MSPEPEEQRQPDPVGEALPEIEDASDPEVAPAPTAPEDEPALLDSEARSLEHPTAESGDSESFVEEVSERASRTAQKDDTSDAGADVEAPEPTASAEPSRVSGNWEEERSAQQVAIELRRLESEVRKLLEGCDSKRKRKLAGTRRWLELEEDIVSWRHSGRAPEDVLCRLTEFVQKRHYLFNRLRFLAGTRATWNT